MNRDDIIKLAREADPIGVDGRLYRMAELTPETIERFAALVATHEREACARIVEELRSHTREGVAAAIRSRTEARDGS